MPVCIALSIRFTSGHGYSKADLTYADSIFSTASLSFTILSGLVSRSAVLTNLHHCEELGSDQFVVLYSVTIQISNEFLLVPSAFQLQPILLVGESFC